jgi:predicted component of viral defense system (DUF524 family)
MEQVGAILGVEPRLNLKVNDKYGLLWTTQAIFPGTNWELVFNKGFGRSSGSYSLSLRPDFALIGPDDRLIFDAKFRLEATHWDPDEDDVPARQAKRADLYKMHTYRDALQARAAVALYPGNKAEFFDVKCVQRQNVTLANLLRDDGWQGVGALPLRPGGLEHEGHER